MSDQSFDKDFIVHNGAKGSNAIVNSIDLAGNCSSTTQVEDYFDILSALSNTRSTDEANIKEIANNSSSEKTQMTKIWSIADILGNSCENEKCSNEISSAPAEENSCNESNGVPAHSSIENQIVTENDNINAEANNVIDNKSQPKSKPNSRPATASLEPVKFVKWMVNGEECFYTVLEEGRSRGYQCGTCRMRFPDKDELYTHQFFTHVTKQVKANDAHICYFCGESFFTSQSLQRHHNHQHPFTCFFCRIEFPSQLHVTQHIYLCHAIPDFS